ncbi:DNA-binding MarR family transcriptional regulator [Anaerobacterium chartisolvens]|uniref:DNA-binding MarR family transcriptional regulator n=1 Tax=Anaerobacterium chartisolvens TaxID=1297424 RepID=A0A369BHH2_9FIRM|nr:MarR family transcriptional regulator [Anaerobacterium chartisolvens]RCX21009.1 DNA-binding MarR family transcriptional regulator [Anaerobacterium chartisolvens]
MKATRAKSTQISWKIRDVHHLHMNHLQNILSCYGLYFGQPRILHTIKELHGATQKEIADKLNVTPASLAVSIKRMERAGLIEKKMSKTDLRRNYITLTEHGTGILNDSYSSLLKMDNKMVQGFSDEELEKLAGYLDRIYENLIAYKTTSTGNEPPSTQQD